MAFHQVSLFARNAANGILSRHLSLAQGPKLIQITPCLWAEPLKKKRKIDPAVVKAREERRKKKMEKEIRRLEKSQRQLKPIEEVEVPLEVLDQKERRTRPGGISAERMEEIIIMKKEWCRHMTNNFLADAQMLDRIASSQQKALEQLRVHSEDLYQAAVQIDESLVPFTFNGPVDTPPIKNYLSPDGEYQDISKKWQ